MDFEKSLYKRSKSNDSSGSHDEKPVQLFQVRGTNEFNTRAQEVTARASSLNSNGLSVCS